MFDTYRADVCNRLVRWFACASAVCLLTATLPGAVSAAESSEEAEARADDASAKSGPVWAGVRELKSHDEQSNTIQAASGLVTGALLVGYGIYEYTSSPRYWASDLGNWTITFGGATALGASIYQTATRHPGAVYAEELLEGEDISEQAAVAYLRYRSRKARRRRIMGATASLFGGAASAGALVLITQFEDESPNPVDSAGRRWAAITVGSVAAGMIVGGVFSLVRKSEAERIYESVAEKSGVSALRTPTRDDSAEFSLMPAVYNDPEGDAAMPGANLTIQW